MKEHVVFEVREVNQLKGHLQDCYRLLNRLSIYPDPANLDIFEKLDNLLARCSMLANMHFSPEDLSKLP